MKRIYKYLFILLFTVGVLYLTMIYKAKVKEEGFSLPGVKLPGIELPNIKIPGMSKIRPYMRNARMLKEEGMRRVEEMATRYEARSIMSN
jgi:hypothetical protein